MVNPIKKIFLDTSRCIGCRSCVAACRECDTHKGESMIYIDYIERQHTMASAPTVCMHCEDPLAPCAQVCPAHAILVSPDGVVQSADETRCIYCKNCGYACPFGVPKFSNARQYMQKCNLCYDRTSQGKGPMCATVCPTQALFYGTYEEWLEAGRAEQGAKPVNTFFFGRQRVQTRNYVVMRKQDEELDLMSLVEEVDLGWRADLPAAAANQHADTWIDAETAGIPQREATRNLRCSNRPSAGRSSYPPIAFDTTGQGEWHHLRCEGDSTMSARNAETCRRKANPDDPPVQRSPRGLHGPLPSPHNLGLQGRIAIVQTQVFLLALIMIVQLWLITNARDQLLSRQTVTLGWLVLASGLGFALALLIAIWPRRSSEEPYKIDSINVVRE